MIIWVTFRKFHNRFKYLILGPGKLSNAISVKTKEAAKRPVVEIAEGEELRVSPNESFSLNCNVTRGDPTPTSVLIYF